MNCILQPIIGKFCAVYLDDIIIYSTTFLDHIDHTKQVFQRLKDTNLKIKMKKCSFALQELHYLRHVVGEDGIKSDSNKLKVIKNLSNPKTVTEVRMAIGLFLYYRRFIKNFATIAEPLYQLTKKNQSWEWTEVYQNAFNTLKTKLTSTPVLVQPNLKQTFILQTDVSDEGLGAVLTQKDSEG